MECIKLNCDMARKNQFSTVAIVVVDKDNTDRTMHGIPGLVFLSYGGEARVVLTSVCLAYDVVFQNL